MQTETNRNATRALNRPHRRHQSAPSSSTWV